jgi:hemerythrin superfamily protein
MDIFDELHQEHESVNELLVELSEGGRDDDTFETMRAELMAHALAEEQVFYKRLEGESETADLVREGYKEHREVLRMLDDMSGSTEDEDTWMSRLQTLADNVQHHVQEEEGRLFPAARGIIAQQEAERLCDRFEDAKRDIAA